MWIDWSSTDHAPADSFTPLCKTWMDFSDLFIFLNSKKHFRNHFSISVLCLSIWLRYMAMGCWSCKLRTKPWVKHTSLSSFTPNRTWKTRRLQPYSTYIQTTNQDVEREIRDWSISGKLCRGCKGNISQFFSFQGGPFQFHLWRSAAQDVNLSTCHHYAHLDCYIKYMIIINYNCYHIMLIGSIHSIIPSLAPSSRSVSHFSVKALQLRSSFWDLGTFHFEKALKIACCGNAGCEWTEFTSLSNMNNLWTSWMPGKSRCQHISFRWLIGG